MQKTKNCLRIGVAYRQNLGDVQNAVVRAFSLSEAFPFGASLAFENQEECVKNESELSFFCCVFSGSKEGVFSSLMAIIAVFAGYPVGSVFVDVDHKGSDPSGKAVLMDVLKSYLVPNSVHGIKVSKMFEVLPCWYADFWVCLSYDGSGADSVSSPAPLEKRGQGVYCGFQEEMHKFYKKVSKECVSERYAFYGATEDFPHVSKILPVWHPEMGDVPFAETLNGGEALFVFAVSLSDVDLTLKKEKINTVYDQFIQEVASHYGGTVKAWKDAFLLSFKFPDFQFFGGSLC